MQNTLDTDLRNIFEDTALGAKKMKEKIKQLRLHQTKKRQ